MPEPGHQVQILRERCAAVDRPKLIQVALFALQQDRTLESAIEYLEIDLKTISGFSNLNWRLTEFETFMLIYLLGGDRVAEIQEEARRPQHDS